MKCFSNPNVNDSRFSNNDNLTNQELAKALRPGKKFAKQRGASTSRFDAAVQTYVNSSKSPSDFKALCEAYGTYEARSKGRDLTSTKSQLREIFFDQFKTNKKQLLFFLSLSQDAFSSLRDSLLKENEQFFYNFLSELDNTDIQRAATLFPNISLEELNIFELLKNCITANKVDLFNQMVQNYDFDLNRTCVDGNKTLLQFAIEQGNTEIVKLLLANEKSVVDVNQKFGNPEQTPLGLAIEQGNTEIVKLLLANEKSVVDVNQKFGNPEQTPLGLAIEQGNTEIVKLLLANEKSVVDVNQKFGNPEQTPLGLAIEQGNTEIVKLLLDKDKVDVNLEFGSFGQLTPLALAIQQGNTEIVELLLDNEKSVVNVNQKFGRHKQSLLGLAIEQGNTEIVKLLLAKDTVDVNQESGSNKQSPLGLAIEQGNTEIVKLLLANEKSVVDVNQESGIFDRTPLALAIKRGSEEIVKLLLANEKSVLNVNQEFGDFKKTPLALAIEYNQLSICKLIIDKLISQRIDINQWGISSSNREFNDYLVKFFLDKADLTSIVALEKMGFECEQMFGNAIEGCDLKLYALTQVLNLSNQELIQQRMDAFSSEDYSLKFQELSFQHLIILARKFKEGNEQFKQLKPIIQGFFQKFDLQFQLKFFQYCHFSGQVDNLLDFCNPDNYKSLLSQAISESQSARVILTLNEKIVPPSIETLCSSFSSVTKESVLTCARCYIALNESSSTDDFNALKNTFQQTFERLEDNDKLFVFWSLSTPDRESLTECFSKMAGIEKKFMSSPLSEQFDFYVQTPELLFANYSQEAHGDALFVRRAPAYSLSAPHPLPVTLQQEGQKTAEFAPFDDGLTTGHYGLNEENVLVAAKRDIGSDTTTKVANTNIFSRLFTEFSKRKNLSSYQRKEAYEALYVMSQISLDIGFSGFLLASFLSDLQMLIDKDNLDFQDFIDFYHYQCECNKDNAKFMNLVESYSKRLNYLEGLQGKMSEQAKRYQTDSSPVSTKHQLMETFSTDQDFKVCLNAVIQEDSGEKEQKAMLQFLFEHQKNIDDFKHTFLKLSQQSPEKMRAYFEEAYWVDCLTSKFKSQPEALSSFSVKELLQKLQAVEMLDDDIVKLLKKSEPYLSRYFLAAHRRIVGLGSSEVSSTKISGDLTAQRSLNEVILVPKVKTTANELSLSSLENLIESRKAAQGAEQPFKMPISFLKVNVVLEESELNNLIAMWGKLRQADNRKALDYFKQLSFDSPEMMIHVLPAIVQDLPLKDFEDILSRCLVNLKAAVMDKVMRGHDVNVSETKVQEMLVHQLLQNFILYLKNPTFLNCMDSLKAVFSDCNWEYLLKQPTQRSFGKMGGGYIDFKVFSKRAENPHAQVYFERSKYQVSLESRELSVYLESYESVDSSTKQQVIDRMTSLKTRELGEEDFLFFQQSSSDLKCVLMPLLIHKCQGDKENLSKLWKKFQTSFVDSTDLFAILKRVIFNCNADFIRENLDLAKKLFPVSYFDAISLKDPHGDLQNSLQDYADYLYGDDVCQWIETSKCVDFDFFQSLLSSSEKTKVWKVLASNPSFEHKQLAVTKDQESSEPSVEGIVEEWRKMIALNADVVARDDAVGNVDVDDIERVRAAQRDRLQLLTSQKGRVEGGEPSFLETWSQASVIVMSDFLPRITKDISIQQDQCLKLWGALAEGFNQLPYTGYYKDLLKKFFLVDIYKKLLLIHDDKDEFMTQGGFVTQAFGFDREQIKDMFNDEQYQELIEYAQLLGKTSFLEL